MSKNKSSAMSNTIIIVTAVAIGWALFLFVLGNGANFEEGDNSKHPLNIMGIMFKGGIIVPFLIAVNLIVIAFTIERLITLGKVGGKGSVHGFIQNIRNLISNNQITEAIAECDKQKGSIANVVRSGLSEYARVQNDSSMDKERKIAAIQKGLEESTALELPMMSKNLVILSTCASIAVLIGLIGTVVGMIRAFSAMAQAGAPDTVALATGISEALINTFFGILGSTLAIILYNFFSAKVDGLTHAIDEAGYSIVQTFATKNK
ncbi:MAG TPA: MotA/TolQ/ExbB proton channel family protein [Bacteroidia bacterium]|jgi:biopolymer transport protein ExbB|nr:MotA/TolQ/ExbB proton channel family protein [Bacteroidia bacterium]HNO70310.1 MotA/TolQ/ExbB proton channel family protein [Bacteroidia bacterium]